MSSEPHPEGLRQPTSLFEEALSLGPLSDQEKEVFLGRFSTFIHPDNLTDEVKREFLIGTLRMGLTGHPEGKNESSIILKVTSILDKGKEAPWER